MTTGNPFLNTVAGPEGTTAFAPTSLISEGGQLAPGIRDAASNFASLESDFLANQFGQKGMLDSSFFEQGIAGAFERGIGSAINLFQGQQDIFSQWAALQNQINADIDPPADDASFGENLFKGIAGGAGVGSAFGPTGAGIGAGIGGGIALADQLFDLDIF